MPRKSKVSKEEALKVLEEFFPHFQSDNQDDWPAYTSKVYLQMSDAVGQKWTAHDWYANIRGDRRQNFSETRKKFHVAEKILNDVSLDMTVDSSKNEKAMNLIFLLKSMVSIKKQSTSICSSPKKSGNLSNP